MCISLTQHDRRGKPVDYRYVDLGLLIARSRGDAEDVRTFQIEAERFPSVKQAIHCWVSSVVIVFSVLFFM